MSKVQFELPRPSLVRIAIYDAMGKEIKLLIFGYLPAGKHSAHWDGTDNWGTAAARGVYYYAIDSRTCHLVRKLIKH